MWSYGNSSSLPHKAVPALGEVASIVVVAASGTNGFFLVLAASFVFTTTGFGFDFDFAFCTGSMYT